MAKKQGAKPQKDCPDLIKARSSWERGRYSEALHRFEKALRRQPGHPMALIDAARAFGSRFHADRAASILAQLEKVGKGQADELVEAAQAYLLCRRQEDASRCLEAALKIEPDHSIANLELAQLLTSAGDPGSACQYVERSLHKDPDSDLAKILHARILSHLGDNDFAYAILLELAEPGVRPLVRGDALSEVARIHEDEGNYDEAFETMMESNAALDRIASKARDEADAIEPVLWQLREAVKPTHLKRWVKLGGQAELESPPIALMTAPLRSGGSLLGRLLSSLPDVAVTNNIAVFSEEIFPAALMAGKEDPNSRSTELFRGMAEAQRQSEALRYRELLLQHLPAQLAQPSVLIDQSPSIVALIPSFLRIIPRGKVIVPLRDPRDILVSSLFAHLPPERNNVALLHPFDAAESISFQLDTWIHYRKMLAPDQWIEFRYEDMVEDRDREIQKICEHLGLEPSKNLDPAAQPQRKSIGRWKHYQSQLAAYYEELEPILDQLGYH